MYEFSMNFDVMEVVNEIIIMQKIAQTKHLVCKNVITFVLEFYGLLLSVVCFVFSYHIYLSLHTCLETTLPCSPQRSATHPMQVFCLFAFFVSIHRFSLLVLLVSMCQCSLYVPTLILVQLFNFS